MKNIFLNAKYSLNSHTVLTSRGKKLYNGKHHVKSVLKYHQHHKIGY